MIRHPGNDRLDRIHLTLWYGLILGCVSGPVMAGETEPTGPHWSFRPIVRRPVPPVGRVHRAHNAIDAFVRRRLDAEEMEPSPPARRETLIRRVTLDLIGLPVPAHEVTAFVNNPCPDAYERVVDRLLASPHYGERWARPWLDVAHYADSDGYLTDQLRPVAWRFRQWVVNALNYDMSFDQFTIEQLAGDLLPDSTIDQRIATGFLRQTLSNREGGADVEEFRVMQVKDRVSTVSTVWLGLTVRCSECHDHKYDPISQQDFYELYAFFNSSDEVNIDAPLPGEIGPYRREKPEYERQRHALVAPRAEQIARLQRRWGTAAPGGQRASGPRLPLGPTVGNPGVDLGPGARRRAIGRSGDRQAGSAAPNAVATQSDFRVLPAIRCGHRSRAFRRAGSQSDQEPDRSAQQPVAETGARRHDP